MGHVWLGFAEDQLRRMLTVNGFDAPRVIQMPADPAAKGPALFVASSTSQIGRDTGSSSLASGRAGHITGTKLTIREVEQ